MSARVFLLVLLFSLQWAGDALAERAAANIARLRSQPNGCGSGWSVYLVPDSIPVLQCTFRAACDNHDNCYGKCEGRARDASAPQCKYLRCRPGGDLVELCRSDATLIRNLEKANARRAACDAGIGADIRAHNKGRPACEAFAYAYEHVLREVGERYFEGINAPKPIDQARYNQEIKEFFRKGTKEEFENFNRDPPSFEKQVLYVRGKGLINIDSD